MIELIKKWLCNHKWELKHSAKLYEYGAKVPYGYLYVLQCEKCGNIKKQKITS